jgi:hypothetical protein
MIKLSLIVLVIIFCACGIYRQNVVNAPLMQQKGQTQLGGHISFNGLEGQAASAVTGRIALLANYQNTGTKIDNNNIYLNKHTFKEVGAGLYKKTEKGKVRETFLMVGTGTSKRTRMKPDSTGNLLIRKANYNRFVLQADFGNTGKKLEHALSSRLAAVHYYKIVDYTSNEFQNLSKFHIYAEEALTLRYRLLDFLAISGQACVTLPVKYSNSGNGYYEFSPFNASIGLIFYRSFLKP